MTGQRLDVHDFPGRKPSWYCASSRAAPSWQWRAEWGRYQHHDQSGQQRKRLRTFRPSLWIIRVRHAEPQRAAHE